MNKSFDFVIFGLLRFQQDCYRKFQVLNLDMGGTPETCSSQHNLELGTSRLGVDSTNQVQWCTDSVDTLNHPMD
ncbi:hypothetical protein ACHQM5_016967 [Ranunculus cassubicifolius]